MRTERDATLDVPNLIIPSVQVNIRAGRCRRRRPTASVTCASPSTYSAGPDSTDRHPASREETHDRHHPGRAPAELRDGLVNGEMLLVDVREPNEYAFERIHGALLYPLSTFDPKAMPADCGPQARRAVRGRRALDARGAGTVAAGHGTSSTSKAASVPGRPQGLPLIRVDPATGQVVEHGRCERHSHSRIEGGNTMNIDRFVFMVSRAQWSS